MPTSVVDVPSFRRLRVHASDPSLALRLQTAPIQEITIRVPWDYDAMTGRLEDGPIGEYLEVVDVDPASGVVYPPIDLDDPNLLAQDGLRPSEGNPQPDSWAPFSPLPRNWGWSFARLACATPERSSAA